LAENAVIFQMFFAHTGFGLCLSFMSAMGAISHWFIKYRQFVLALWSAAGALGIFAMAPFIQLLVDVYSWRGATIVLAGVCLNITLTGMAYFPVKDTGPGRPARALGDRKSIHKLLFSNAAYLFHLANSFFMFGMPLFLIFIVRHATRHRGLTSQEGALLVSICGVTSFLGRVMFMLINLVQVLATKEVRFYLFNFASLFGAVACAIVPIFWNFYAVAVVCGVMGFMQGVKLSTMMNVTMDITSPPRFQIGFGYFSLAVGISVLTVPPFAGNELIDL
jgi:MFS family permease